MQAKPMSGTESLLMLRGIIGDMSAEAQGQINLLAAVIRCVAGMQGGVPELALVAAEWQAMAEAASVLSGEQGQEPDPGAPA